MGNYTAMKIDDMEAIYGGGATTKRTLTPGPDGIRLLCIGAVPGDKFTAHPATELGGPESF